MGRGTHTVRARIGVMMNMEMEDVAGCSRSVMNNLTASAMGCNRPYGPTIFGPFRSCI